MSGMKPRPKGDFLSKAQKKAVSACPLCGATFGVTRWKYYCHCCGKVYCNSCTKTEVPLPPLYTEPVKVCNSCAGASPSKGQGRVLGGESVAPQRTPEEERELRARAAEGRAARQSGLRPLSSAVVRSDDTKQPDGPGNVVRGESEPCGGSNPALMAALARQQQPRGRGKR